MAGQREGSGIIRWRSSLRVVCFYLASMLALITSRVESMTMDVEDGNGECVIITASKGNTINANYEVRGIAHLITTPLVFSRRIY